MWICWHPVFMYQLTSSTSTRRVLSGDTWNPLLSVHNLNILFLHTPCINNALLRSSLSRMKTELPCSPHSSSTIRDMSFPIPNPPLNCRGKLQLFSISTSKSNTSVHLCVLGWVVKSPAWQNGSTRESKVWKRQQKSVFSFSWKCSNNSTKKWFVQLWEADVLMCKPVCLSPVITCRETLPPTVRLVNHWFMSSIKHKWHSGY